MTGAGLQAGPEGKRRKRELGAGFPHTLVHTKSFAHSSGSEKVSPGDILLLVFTKQSEDSAH